jgi:hypothetical protein
VIQTLSEPLLCLKGHDRDIRLVYSSGTSTEVGCLVTNQTDCSSLSHLIGKTMRDSRVFTACSSLKSRAPDSGALFAVDQHMLTSALHRRVGAARQVKAKNKRGQRHAGERSVGGTPAGFQLAPPNCSAEELRSVIARNVMVWIGSGRPGDSVGTGAPTKHFEGGTGYGGKRRRQ